MEFGLAVPELQVYLLIDGDDQITTRSASLSEVERCCSYPKILPHDASCKRALVQVPSAYPAHRPTYWRTIRRQ
jgi:hypothetical protein